MSEFESKLFDILVVAGFVVAIAVFLLLFFISAPYGRHTRGGWGPTVSTLTGWILMEVPAALFVPAFFFWGAGFEPQLAWILLAFWILHYGNRGLVYPFRLRTRSKRMPILIPLMGILFNLFNGYLNGRYLGLHAETYDASWFLCPRFFIGAAMFLVGFAINIHADEVLLRLRAPGEKGYKIPRGGMYRWISSPNYFGELVEWAGWALMCWSVPGLLFAVWTTANLFPRAIKHHKWYREEFEDYPPERKAVIPFIV